MIMKKNKYGHESLHEMVQCHVDQLRTRIMNEGLDIHKYREMQHLRTIYKSFLDCKCNFFHDVESK